MSAAMRKYKSLYSSTTNSFGTGTGETITPASVVDLPTGEITLTFDRVDSSGVATPTKMERITGSISGGNFIISARGVDGTTEQAHTSPVVEMVWNADDWNDAIDAILSEHTASGTHTAITASTINGNTVATGTDAVVLVTASQTLTNKTLTSPTINTPTINTPTINGTITLDTDAQTSITNLGASSMSRQAIMNGNFDVWQRGTSVAITDGVVQFQADRWQDQANRDGGTLPTLTRSRQALTTGDIPNAFYYSRLTTNGAGISLGVNSRHPYPQYIEHGTRLLCGNGKKVTVSFWARSDIANKRICPSLWQTYGTGGSPTALEPITGTPITLTSTWTKYTQPFTTNTLVGKTFGTNNDDHLALVISYMWGTTFGNTYVSTGVTTETYVGAGYVDIAQVQLCAGDVALPFQPKSYEEELRACQRYYELFTGQVGMATGATTGDFGIVYKVPKRALRANTDFSIGTSTVNAAELGISTRTFNAITAASGSTVNGTSLSLGGASSMTAGKVLVLLNDLLAVSAEL